MKVCRCCGVEKPLSEFYAHAGMKDGRLNKCIECVKSRVKSHRQENLEDIRRYDRIRGRTEERKAATKQRRPRYKDKTVEYNKKWRERNPEKYKAHCALNNAVRDGIVKKGPCEVCGREDVHGHHDDYSKPLEVRWLCPDHHKEGHRKD